MQFFRVLLKCYNYFYDSDLIEAIYSYKKPPGIATAEVIKILKRQLKRWKILAKNEEKMSAVDEYEKNEYLILLLYVRKETNMIFFGCKRGYDDMGKITQRLLEERLRYYIVQEEKKHAEHRGNAENAGQATKSDSAPPSSPAP